jgi:membrane protein YdbS with pleckstrin-like domain
MILSFLALIIPIGMWIPAYYASIRYWIQPESVKAARGVFWKKISTVPYHKITNIDITQGPLQRAFGIGTIHLQTAGASGSQGGQAELLIYGIKDLDGIKEMIMASVVRLRDADRPTVHKEAGEDASAQGMLLAELVRIRKLIEDHRK